MDRLNNVRILLRVRLAVLDWKQKDLARESGVSSAHVSQFMNNKKQITLDKLDRLLNAAGLQLVITVVDTETLTQKENLR